MANMMSTAAKPMRPNSSPIPAKIQLRFSNFLDPLGNYDNGGYLLSQALFAMSSGGISTLDDLRELALYENEGIDSALIGKALYEGRFSLEEALAAVAEVSPLDV